MKIFRVCLVLATLGLMAHVPAAEIHDAVKNNDAASVKELVAAGVDVNETESGKLQVPLVMAASMGNMEIAQILMKAGANVNQRDSMGYTPLLAAARYGHDVMAKYLISKGADIEAQTYLSSCGYITARWSSTPITPTSPDPIVPTP